MLCLAAIWPLLQIAAVPPPNFEIFDAGLPQRDESSLGCFGDFNSDKHTDIFTISSKGTLHVYLYEKGTHQFVPVLGPTAIISESFPITNCIPGDFNYDGKLDMLVQGPNDEGFQGTIHLGFLTVFATSFTLPQTMDQVIVMDANNDLRPDLYGMSKNGQRMFWINTPGSEGRIEFVGVPHKVEGFNRLSQPHSNAFIDLNGDCLPDLFLAAASESERRFEVWINKGTNSPDTAFELSVRNTFVVPDGTGQTTFADFDGDGAVDVMFPICEAADCQNASIHILYNMQAPLCNSQTEGYCRQSYNLCLADSDFLFNISSPSQHTTLPRSLFTGYLLAAEPDLPPWMGRTADLNMDGYPDLLLPVINTATNVSTLSLWVNVPCDTSRCHAQAIAMNRRTFRRELDGNEILDELPGAYAGAAFDIHDDGTQDVIVLQRLFVNNSGTMEAIYTAVALDALRHVDTYFLTTLGSNGVCETMCPTDKWPEKFPNPKPYGVSQAGVTVKFTVADMDGVNWLLTGAQLSQSAYLSLQLPYTLFGLGRTNSLIDELAIGFPIAGGHHSRQFSGLIPNSQLAIFPWPPDNDRLWVVEMFLSSGDWIVTVITALFVVLFVLGTVTLVLHLRAQRESLELKERMYAF